MATSHAMQRERTPSSQRSWQRAPSHSAAENLPRRAQHRPRRRQTPLVPGIAGKGPGGSESFEGIHGDGLVGGGDSLPRTRLRGAQFPANREINRELPRMRGLESDFRPNSPRTFRALTRKYPAHRNREFFGANRESIRENREFGPPNRERRNASSPSDSVAPNGRTELLPAVRYFDHPISGVLRCRPAPRSPPPARSSRAPQRDFELISSVRASGAARGDDRVVSSMPARLQRAEIGGRRCDQRTIKPAILETFCVD
jgi:hypothetical protein